MNKHAKKMAAPVVITVLLIGYYAAYFGIVMKLTEGMTRILFGMVLLLLAAGMIYVCIERIHEIKGGEEDDLSQY